jgi:uncharacterized heparinase superfamily protein
VLIADIGTPPPLDVSGGAHAGCLSFELSDGRHPVLINAGAPGPAHLAWSAKARATANHNTLNLGGQSSSKLVRDERLEDSMGAAPLRLPDHVTAALDFRVNGDMALVASHDGYVERYGIVHHRHLTLRASGDRLDGRDTLGAPSGRLRLPTDLPFAVHFHFAPNVLVTSGLIAGTAEINVCDDAAVGGASMWRFAVVGAELSIEDSVHLALAAGPAHSQQIVLRGATFGETEILWSMKRVLT